MAVDKPTLQRRYEEEIRGALQKEFGLSTVMAVPRLEKIVINVGLGDAVQNPKLIDGAVDQIGEITGQRPVITRARKAISNFKLREKMPIGVSVTLRRERMYEFLERFIRIALPRVRDFRGLPNKGFDGRGNLSVGLKEQIIFPEIDLDKIEKLHGMSVTIVTTANDDVQGRALLTQLGMPFRPQGGTQN
jgi:large subunit ribosomal protein L5